jgi:hypothetical protein
MLRRTLILFASVCALEPVTTRPQTSRRHFVAGAAASLAFPRAASAALSDYKTELFSESGCGRRGILGACTGGAAPTVDKTAAEEQAGALAGARRAAEAKAGMIDEESPLVLRLRKQTEDNAAKNKRQVDLEMFANSQSGEFGPFSRYVPVEKQSGEFVLVRYPDYERLKKQKKVVKQKFNNDADAKPYERVAPDMSGLPKFEGEDE